MFTLTFYKKTIHTIVDMTVMYLRIFPTTFLRMQYYTYSGE